MADGKPRLLNVTADNVQLSPQISWPFVLTTLLIWKNWNVSSRSTAPSWKIFRMAYGRTEMLLQFYSGSLIGQTEGIVLKKRGQMTPISCSFFISDFTTGTAVRSWVAIALGLTWRLSIRHQKIWRCSGVRRSSGSRLQKLQPLFSWLGWSYSKFLHEDCFRNATGV